MNGEWCYFKSYFSKQQCEDIINLGLTIPSQQAHVGVNGVEGVDPQARRSPIRFINNGDWRFQHVFDELWKTAIQANKDFFNIHISKLDFIQLAEYDAAELGEYKEHHDVFWINDDPYYHRKLSAIIQLSDPNDYEGGDFELTDVGTFPPANELREQGTVIFFPSMFRHRANPVIRGTRYSIAAWFEGPKWR
jgi:PKHD-type hydroxylase